MPDPNWWNGAPGELRGDWDRERGERDDDDELAYCASCGHVLDRIAIKVRHHDQWVWVCGELCQQDLEARVE